ncbi:hypothetical protein RZP13_27955, partial [Klebsiella quasipneumoniae subsp. similipneumoniae]|nr:hypothetical protein [Klebsiella quasipneumoniae subsp. similipneumoniae]
MDSKELMHVIALLLEDSKRLQELEPNAGTEARIWLAKEGANKQVISSQADSLIKISRIWAD